MPIATPKQFAAMLDAAQKGDYAYPAINCSSITTLNAAFKAFADQRVSAKVIQVSCDAHNHRGGGADHFGLPPMDVYLMCESDAAVPLLLDAVSARATPPRTSPRPRRRCR